MLPKEPTPKTIYLSEYQPSAFVIDATKLHVDLKDKETIVSAELYVRANPAATTISATLSLDATDMDILEVCIDGSVIDESAYSYENSKLIIHQVPSEFTLATKVQIYPEKNTSLMGLYKSRTMFCTQCEPEGFRKITPYIDRPDVMSEFTTKIVANPRIYPVLLSNGNPVSERDLEDGRKEVVWHDPFKKPAYLFALVAGNLACIKDSFVTCSGREIEIRIYVEEKDLDKCDHALTSLKTSMKWDEDTYGREYDLDVFMIVAVDDFNMGAMENKGLNIFNTSAVLANPKTTTDARFQWVEAVVAHEYFHNWSGNRVTCRDWFQLSLKEGFTVYRDSEFSADLNSRTVKRVEDVRALRSRQFAEDAGPLAHPVQPDSYMEINNFYTRTVYDKGAEVVRMQANLLGKELFRKGTDLYFERHDGQAVTIEDFVSCMETVSNSDLTQFKRWYKQAGTPELSVEQRYDSEHKTLTLSFSQRCPPTPELDTKEPFVIPLRMGLLGASSEIPLYSESLKLNGETETVLIIDQAKQSITFDQVDEEPVPSLLRGFSAPVKLSINQSHADLIRIITTDSDGFNRWDASQRLVIDDIHRYRDQIVAGEQLEDSDEHVDTALVLAIKQLLDAGIQDKAMIAQMISLPSMDELAELENTIDIDALYQARDLIRFQIANGLKSQFETLYGENQSNAVFAPSADQIAERSLKNQCLRYWFFSETEDALNAAVSQFEQATNMTDQSAALSTLVNSDWKPAISAAEDAVNAFYEQWKHEALVVNLWFGIQAGSSRTGVLQRVEALKSHPAFDIKNPNKAGALLGGFCTMNPNNFHHIDGSGYEFIADQVIELDKINPQVASRLVIPLTKWRKQDDKRAALMHKQLDKIVTQDNLSSDVNELVTKSL